MDSRKTLTVNGTGALSRPLQEFAEELQDRFSSQLEVVEQRESCNRWSVRCRAIISDRKTMAALEEYLQNYFPSNDGTIEVDDCIIPLFSVVPGVFFVVNVTDEEGDKVEVQLLDRFGRARNSRVVNADESDIVVEEIRVPHAVIAAGLRLNVGTGDFVDSQGVQVLPQDIARFTTDERA